MENDDYIELQLNPKQACIELDLVDLPLDPLIFYEIYNCNFVELFIYFIIYIFLKNLSFF